MHHHFLPPLLEQAIEDRAQKTSEYEARLSSIETVVAGSRFDVVDPPRAGEEDINLSEEGKEGGDGASALPVEVESQRVPKPRRRLVEDEQTDMKHQEEPKGAGRQHLFHDGAIPREDRCKETVVVGVVEAVLALWWLRHD